MAKNSKGRENKAEKSKDKNGSGHHYDASSIQVLEGLDPVRKRPGMYIGTTGPDGLHHLITEIFDNSRDEAMGGFCNDIEIVLLPGNRVRVADNGRGIPVDTHKQTKVSALETIMTTLHAGGKFGGEGYKVSGGLHGVGASVVNALSIFCEVVVHRDGGIYYQEYKQGKRKSAVKKIGSSKLHGTIVTFEPDAEIFKEGIVFDFNRVVVHMRQQAYLVRGLRISVIDVREAKEKIDLADVFYFRELGIDAPSQSFYFEGGLISLVKFNNSAQKPIHKNIFYVEKKVDGVESVEVALQYVDDISARIMPFANNIYNGEGGTHLTGFKTALTRTLNSYGRKNNFVKESEDNFTGEDVLEGLTAVISVKLREIQFEGQTKAKLGSVEAQSAVNTVFGEAFSAFLEENPDDARSIVNKVILALKARKAAKAAKDSVLRKGALEGMTLPGKLADCETKSAEESELFIVEGDSAGGCFSADTKVALVDGRALSFIELIREHEQGKQNYCYTIRGDGSVAVAPIEHPRLTKKQAEVVKVILDNGEEIVCTPDHKFMIRDGSFKMAKNLKTLDSLMPLRRQISKLGKRITIKGYELVWSAGEHRWIFTHLLADKYNINNGLYTKENNSVIHHKDFNKRNNNPDNLVRMDKQWTSEFRSKRKEAYDRTYLTKALKHLHDLWISEGSIDALKYNAIRKETGDRSLIRLETIASRFFNGDESKLKEAVANFNHRIKKVIPLSEKIDVYDLEVSGTHNFALESGVFVHNSSKQGRDRRTQAVLPLKGKILNVERARLDKVLDFAEIKYLIIALGTAIGDTFDISKLRYHKVIIATDADVDGAHIRTLLLTLFYRYLKPLLEGGFIYIAQPPLYKIKRGKEIIYVYSDEEKMKVLGKDADKMSELPEAGDEEISEADEALEASEAKKPRVSIQRYKGLGEMNPEELWETTMDPAKRVLKQVKIEDALEADKVFDILMGTDVPSRKSFIQSNAKKATIDI